MQNSESILLINLQATRLLVYTVKATLMATSYFYLISCLPKLLPHLDFCFADHRSHSPSGLPVPACCFRRPLGQPSPKGLLLQLDGLFIFFSVCRHVRHRRISDHNSMSMSPTSPGMHEKFFQRRELKTQFIRSVQQSTQPTHHQVVISWQLYASLLWVFKTYDCRSDGTNTKWIIDLWSKVFWCQCTGIHGSPYVMANPWLAQKSNNKAPLRFRSARPLLPITPLQVSPLLMSVAVPKQNFTISFPGPHPGTLRSLDNPNCCSVHRYKQQLEPSSQWLVVTKRQPSRSPWKTLTQQQPGAPEYPHACPVHLTLGNSRKGKSGPSPGVWFQTQSYA